MIPSSTIYPAGTTPGFTLVETLVAISVLLIVIVGPMTVATNSARSTSFSSEQVQAFFLAQEGLELAQQARDDALLAVFPDFADGWDDFTDDGSGGEFADCLSGRGCGLEFAESGVTVRECNNDSCRLYYASGNDRNRFTHDATNNEPTPFIREIRLTPSTDSNQLQVVSTVRWRTGPQSAEQVVELDTYLFNIYGN